MSPRLVDRLGLGGRELVAIVGAGGKSTILACIGRELAASGAAVVVTTTTKMGADQATEPSVFSSDPLVIIDAVDPGRSLFVGAARDDEKVTGLAPEVVTAVHASPRVDAVVVEADGARSRLIKAPAPHEPVVPAGSTTVIVVASLAALGRPIDEVAHRPERVARIIGVAPSAELTPRHMVDVLTHAEGGLSRVADATRVVVALVAPTEEDAMAAVAVRDALEAHPRVERVVVVPW